jgi:hypothetical protein
LTTARYLTPQGRSVQRPVPGTALADVIDKGRVFQTDAGRALPQGAGVQPDRTAPPWRLDEWATVLAQSTGFINFAQSYIERHGKVDEAFEVDDSTLNDFRRYLQQSGFRIPPASWSAAVPFMKVQIKTELFNLVFGASKGDEVDLRGDPQVQSAVGAMTEAQQLLREQK